MGKRRAFVAIGLLIAIAGLRIWPGALFGGTKDQAFLMQLWSVIQAHENPYTATIVIPWPPLGWFMVAAWSSLWTALDHGIAGFGQSVSPSLFLKCLYFAFEIGLAGLLGHYLQRRGREGESRSRVDGLEAALYFLAMPATWTITALHGNLDVVPAFFTMAAFLVCADRRSSTAAAVAALLLGAAVAARSFPVLLAAPLLVDSLRRHGPGVALWCGILIALPMLLSFYPVYLLVPEALDLVVGYRGILSGWWGLPGIARLVVSDGFSISVLEWNLDLFYVSISAFALLVTYWLWTGRISLLRSGLLLVLAMFCLAPTISLQNFYFFLPWAFWFAMTEGCRCAKVLLWVVSIHLFLVYVVVPDDLSTPVWFYQTFWYREPGLLAPIASPGWLVAALRGLAAAFKRPDLPFNVFIQNVLRIPVWLVLWSWLIRELRHLRLAPPAHRSAA